MRQMFRYEVPADGEAHEFRLTSAPVAVAAVHDERLGYAGWVVEFWAEHEETDAWTPSRQAFRVFGTGEPLPLAAHWVGTCQRIEGLVWHLFEVIP